MAVEINIENIALKKGTIIKSIPRTGRIGRFAKIIEKEFGEKVLLQVMQNSDKYVALKIPERASWWESAIKKLGKEIGKDKAENIMRLCGQKCCGQGIRKTAKRLMNESNSIEVEIKQSIINGAKTCIFLIHIGE